MQILKTFGWCAACVASAAAFYAFLFIVMAAF